MYPCSTCTPVGSIHAYVVHLPMSQMLSRAYLGVNISHQPSVIISHQLSAISHQPSVSVPGHPLSAISHQCSSAISHQLSAMSHHQPSASLVTSYLEVRRTFGKHVLHMHVAPVPPRCTTHACCPCTAMMYYICMSPLHHHDVLIRLPPL